MNRRRQYLAGLKAGVAIGLGYLAVAFTLGITARGAGLTAFQATLTSFLINASAGEYVGFSLMAAGAGYAEVALMEAVANARYLLMSFALSQKLEPKTGIGHRLLLGWYVTDEVFSVSVSVPGKLDPFFSYGVILPACIGWAGGTCLGVLMGSILPGRLVSALSVGLYGMFISVFIPAAKGNRAVFLSVIAAMAGSCLMQYLPFLEGISSGTKTILLTVAVAALAAWLRPIREAEKEESDEG